jgi:hypothetical protein
MFVSAFSDFESPSNFLLGDVALVEFDPRTNMITDAVWGGSGAFEPVPGAFIDPQINLDDLRDGVEADRQVGLGLAVVGNNVHFIVDINDVNNNRVEVLVDLDFAPGSGSNSGPRLLSIESLELTESNPTFFDIPIGLSAINPGNATGPRGPMSDPGPGGIDRNTIDPLFADVAYTQSALDSGAVQALFLDAFLRSAQDPMGCVNSNLMSMVGPTLQARVEQTIRASASSALPATACSSKRPRSGPLPSAP